MTEMTKRSVCSGVSFKGVQDSRFKTMRVSVHFLLPIDETSVAANAMLPSLLCRASKDYPDYTKLSKRLAELYGASLNSSASKIGDVQVLSVSVSGISDRYTIHGEKISMDLTNLLVSIIADPPFENGEFRGEDFKQEKRQTLELIDAEFNDKRTYARQKCEQIMFENEVYGTPRYGSKEAVSALTAKDVAAAWSYLIEHAQIEIMALGDCDVNLIYDSCVSAFSKISRSDVVACRTEIKAEVETVKEVKEPMAVAQSKLVMGFRTGISAESARATAATLMASMFGGTPSSKLFLHVREEKSLCYYCAARNYNAKAILFVDSGVETKNIDAAKSEILIQLDALKTGEFTDEEMMSAKMSICNGYHGVYDYLGGIESWYLAQIFLPKIESPEEAAEKINRVTRAEIIEAANCVVLDTVYQLVGTEEGE